MLDFRKAFDTVLHLRLLSKLDHLGISGPIHDWLKTFLTCRKQKVVVDGVESTAEEVISGVPQGTVMGPLLFCYISMICRNPSVLNLTRLFADDCLIYHIIQNQSDHQVLQDDLKQLETWQQQWLMQFNPSKCTVIRMTSIRRKPKIFDYTLCGQILNPVDSNPYLGVELTRTMSWNLHIDNTVKKANSVMGLIKRNLYDAPKNTKALAYQSIVRPTLE